MTVDNRLNLIRAFNDLRLEVDRRGGDRYLYGRRICDNPLTWIAVDESNYPSLLFATTNNEVLLPIKLRNIGVRPTVQCTIQSPSDESWSGQAHQVICWSDEPEVQDYFLRILGILLDEMRISGITSLNNALNRIVELFRDLARPPKKAIQGLWAELLLIELSLDPSTFIDCWHSEQAEHFDFSVDGTRLEVKSSSKRSRAHHFSLEQLNPPDRSVCWIASVFVDDLAGGRSILDLIESISLRCNGPEGPAKILSTLPKVLGCDYDVGVTRSFDYELGVASISFYNASLIPAIRPPIADGVRDVNFVSSLDLLPVQRDLNTTPFPPFRLS